MRTNFYAITTACLRGGLRLAPLATALLLAPAAWAQAPANDECTGAIVLPVGTTCAVTIATNVGATTGAAPVVSCGDSPAVANNDVWYRLVVPASGNLIVTTSAVAGSALDDTVLELYSGACGSLTSIGCNDDGGAAGFSKVAVTGQTPGATIYARAFGFDSSIPTGQFGICARTPQPPANDNCSGAIALASTTTCTPITVTNDDALPSTGVPPLLPAAGCFPANTVIGNDMWYSIVVPASGGVTVTTSEVAGSPVEDTGLILYSGTCGTLQQIGCNDDIGQVFFASTRAVGLTPGTTVYARVWTFDGTSTGQFGICAVPVPANDAAVQVVYATGKAPVQAPQVVQAVVRNAGGLALTNVPIVLTVAGTTTFTNTQVIPSLAVGASVTLTFSAYTPSATGSNTLTVTAPADELNTNNSQRYTQAVTANDLTYVDDAQPLSNDGIGVDPTSPGGILAVKYTIPSAATVGAVRLRFPNASTSTPTTYQVVVLGATSTGAPGPVLFTSPTQSRSATASTVTVPVTGAVTVNGPFYVGVKEVTGGVEIGYQVESPLRPATFYFQQGGTTTWQDLVSLLPLRLAIEVGFSARVLATRNAALEQAIAVYPNPARQTFALRLPALANQRTAQLTLLNTLGQQVRTQAVSLNAAGTETQVNVSGLAAGIYTLRIQTNGQLATKQVVIE